MVRHAGGTRLRLVVPSQAVVIWAVPTGDGSVTVREQLEPDGEPAVLELFADCSDWFEATTGPPPGPSDVQSLFYALPEGADSTTSGCSSCSLRTRPSTVSCLPGPAPWGSTE